MSPVLDAPTSYLSEPPVASQALFRISSASQAASVYSVPALLMTVPYEVANTQWFRPVVSGFERTFALRPGWDSYSALPTRAAEVQEAIVFLASFLDRDSAAPTVVALPDGGVQLEWHRGGVDVEATFPVADTREVYLRDIETGEERELSSGDGLSEPTIRQYVSRLRA